MSNDNYVPPEDLVAKTGLFAGMNVFMGIASMVMILAFVGFTISDVEYSSAIFSAGKNFIIGTMDWFYVVVVNFALFFVFWLLISRYGDVKLGKDDETPDFSTFSWICMLFSAGLGSGLIYWGVAEPMYHIQDNPFMTRGGIEANSMDAAALAIQITDFHWGLHGWALYVLVGLSLAYFSYRKDLPLTLRSALYPVLKERVYGPWGHIIDLIGVFGTIFGLATSLGLGVTPIAAGLENLGWMENTQTNQLILIAFITCLGTASAASGVGKGVRILSECNVWASFGLLLLFLIPRADRLHPRHDDHQRGRLSLERHTDGLLDRQRAGAAVAELVDDLLLGMVDRVVPLCRDVHRPHLEGRTIRQFSFCVLLVPTSVVVLWMGIFGSGATGVDQLYNAGVAEAVNADYASGVFATVAGFGYSYLVTPITVLITILLISWFVTSSDSGTLVMCTMLSMGDEHPPIKFRVFWGLTSGVVAGGLMLAGGLSALQTASIVAGLPIAIILLMMGYGMVTTLKEDFPAPDVEDKYELEYLNR